MINSNNCDSNSKRIKIFHIIPVKNSKNTNPFKIINSTSNNNNNNNKTKKNQTSHYPVKRDCDYLSDN